MQTTEMTTATQRLLDIANHIIQVLAVRANEENDHDASRGLHAMSERAEVAEFEFYNLTPEDNLKHMRDELHALQSLGVDVSDLAATIDHAA